MTRITLNVKVGDIIVRFLAPKGKIARISTIKCQHSAIVRRLSAQYVELSMGDNNDPISPHLMKLDHEHELQPHEYIEIRHMIPDVQPKEFTLHNGSTQVIKSKDFIILDSVLEEFVRLNHIDPKGQSFLKFGHSWGYKPVCNEVMDAEFIQLGPGLETVEEKLMTLSIVKNTAWLLKVCYWTPFGAVCCYPMANANSKPGTFVFLSFEELLGCSYVPEDKQSDWTYLYGRRNKVIVEKLKAPDCKNFVSEERLEKFSFSVSDKFTHGPTQIINNVTPNISTTLAPTMMVVEVSGEGETKECDGEDVKSSLQALLANHSRYGKLMELLADKKRKRETESETESEEPQTKKRKLQHDELPNEIKNMYS